MYRALAGFGLFVLLSSHLLGQSKDTFEIADVHLSATGASQGGGFLPGGRLELKGMTMLDLVSIAYGVENSAVAGGPAWINSKKFDIVAKAPAGTLQPGGPRGKEGPAGVCPHRRQKS